MVEEEEEEEESLGKGEVKENEGEEGESFVQSVNAFNEVESERGRTEEQQGRPVTTVPLYCASVFVCVCVHACVCVCVCVYSKHRFHARQARKGATRQHKMILLCTVIKSGQEGCRAGVVGARGSSGGRWRTAGRDAVRRNRGDRGEPRIAAGSA